MRYATAVELGVPIGDGGLMPSPPGVVWKAVRRELVKALALKPLPAADDLVATIGERRASFELLASSEGRITCLRADELFVIDHDVFGTLRARAQEELRAMLGRNVVWLRHAHEAVGGMHTAATLLAILGHPMPAPFAAIDAGAGSGVLGLVRWRRGAARVVFIEHEAGALAEARDNAALNGVPATRSHFVHGDLADAEAIVRTLPLAEPRVALDGNLGFWPEYPVTSLSVYRLAHVVASGRAAGALTVCSGGHLAREQRVLPLFPRVRGPRRLVPPPATEWELLRSLGLVPVLVQASDQTGGGQAGWTAVRAVPSDSRSVTVLAGDVVGALERSAPHLLDAPVVRLAQVEEDLSSLACEVLRRLGFRMRPAEARLAPGGADPEVEAARAFVAER